MLLPYEISKSNLTKQLGSDEAIEEGGLEMRIMLLSTVVVALTAAVLAASSLSAPAQEGGQYTSDDQYSDPAVVPVAAPTEEGGQYASDDQYVDPAQYTPAAEQQASTICAPWSKEWSISGGQWYYDWYRWCVNPSLYDPLYESSWYKEQGGREYGEQVNLCPETGKCTVSPGGGVKMQTTTPTP
jgi:hypothetical protein